MLYLYISAPLYEADMHKYNMLYTIKFIEHVLTPESGYKIKL